MIKATVECVYTDNVGFTKRAEIFGVAWVLSVKITVKAKSTISKKAKVKVKIKSGYMTNGLLGKRRFSDDELQFFEKRLEEIISKDKNKFDLDNLSSKVFEFTDILRKHYKKSEELKNYINCYSKKYVRVNDNIIDEMYMLNWDKAYYVKDGKVQVLVFYNKNDIDDEIGVVVHEEGVFVPIECLEAHPFLAAFIDNNKEEYYE